jgi:hypothetical protein
MPAGDKGLTTIIRALIIGGYEIEKPVNAMMPLPGACVSCLTFVGICS